MASFASISFRPSRKIQREFSEFLREENGDRSETCRVVFQEGLHELRLKRGLEKFAAGKVSLLGAAKLAGVSVYEFLKRVELEGVEFVKITKPELEREKAKAFE